MMRVVEIELEWNYILCTAGTGILSGIDLDWYLVDSVDPAVREHICLIKV